MNNREIIGKLLADMLEGEFAHASFDQAVKNIPLKFTGIHVEELPYTIWQLVEHIRITQWDIVKFSFDKSHQSPQWPEGYWPKEKFPPDKKAWNQSLKNFRADRKLFLRELKNPEKKLLEPFQHGQGQNLMREAILLIDHTAYHTGQIILIRKILGIW